MEQHGLLLQKFAGLAVLQHALDDVARLIGLVAHADEKRTLIRSALAPEGLGEALHGEIDDRIRCRQDRLGRPVIALQCLTSLCLGK